MLPYRQVGNKSLKDGSAPLLLVHGGPGMTAYIDTLAHKLSKQFAVISYDQRHAGELQTHALDLIELAKHLEQESGFAPNIIAHSFGGIISLLAVAQFGLKASTLHIVGIAPFDLPTRAQTEKNILARLTPDEVSRRYELLAQMGSNLLSSEQKSESDLEFMRLSLVAFFGSRKMADAQDLDALLGAHTLQRPIHFRDLKSLIQLNRDFTARTAKGEILEWIEMAGERVSYWHGTADAVPVDLVQAKIQKLAPKTEVHILDGMGHYPWLEGWDLSGLVEKLR